ncbi:MAG: hypothetical protein ABI333_30290 [bacterium]
MACAVGFLTRPGRPGLVLLAAVLVSTGPGCGGRTPFLGGELCSNGLDDDGDGLTDCEDQDCAGSPSCGDTVCGDGVAQGGEDCDGSDFRGYTCADLVPGSGGTLGCRAECLYDTAGCAYCGDGMRQLGEECDCGMDPLSLPFGCPAINGGIGSNCSTDCRLYGCGDGNVQGNEECDCGTDPANLPPGCSDVNGGPNGECGDDCLLTEICEHQLWDECDPLLMNQCCSDDWGVPTDCRDLAGYGFYCMRECNTTSDCYWSNECVSWIGGGCYASVCGPGYSHEEMNAFCEVAGGGTGWCAPLYERGAPGDDQYGVCLEAGTLQHGDSCVPGHILETDRSEDVCELGVCIEHQGGPSGRCIQLCGWEDAHDAAVYGLSGNVLPCPDGASCYNAAYIDQAAGLRRDDLSYCWSTTATDPTNGVDSCSLVTSQLLADPTRTCADLYPNGRCMVIVLSGSQPANGTLIGACAQTQPVTRDVWELCDQPSDVCASGSRCFPEDFHAANPAGAFRCLPFCDVPFAQNVLTCTQLGAPAGTDCRSLSEKLAPTDISPARLGFCAFE